MSVSLISVIIGRIASATEASPIAVFGATVISQRLSKTDQRFIGMFHRKMDRAEVKKMLMSAATK